LNWKLEPKQIGRASQVLFELRDISKLIKGRQLESPKK
jgi:hypothetical protein